jgi:N-acetylmuramoyl-L-alanine amidase
MGITQIKEWQRRIGVTEDGIFGQVTLETSLDLYDEAYPEPPAPSPPVPVPTGDKPYSVKANKLYNGIAPVSSKPSPNHGGEITPELIVIHYTGDNGTGGLQWLCDPSSGVSAHLWISKAGVVWQLLPLNIRGWHAGVSSWQGKAVGNSVNAFSIGIENQGIGDEWPEAQVSANKQVIEALMIGYPSIRDVAGHDQVAFGRKVDPGPRYPWKRIFPSWNQE